MRLQQYITENKMKPTKEMVDFYLKRTQKHIDRVRKNCNILSKKLNMVELIDRGVIHDKSKYESEEYIPYIWMTWYYKEKDNGFEYPNKDIKDSTMKAWRHHERVNSHHPGYHKDVKNMTDIDLAEMVCDLVAMSQELGGNTKEFFNKNIKTKFNFADNQYQFIYKCMELL